MPWLNDKQPASEAAQKWQTAFKNAMLRRIRAAQLEAPLTELSMRYPLGSKELSDVLLGFRAKDPGTDDPLLFEYAKALLQRETIRVKDLFVGLLETSRFASGIANDHSAKASPGLPLCEERFFSLITQMYMTEQLKCSPVNLHGLVYVIARWLHAMSQFEMSQQLTSTTMHTVDPFSFSMYEAMALLALTILGQPAFRNVGKQSWWKKRRPILVDQLRSFDTHVLHWMQSQFSGRLQALTNVAPYLETDDQGHPIFTDQQILQSIEDLPIVNTRAGLYIWLNACLYSRPYTDDTNLFMYLQARFAGNLQPLVSDLLIASFDVLTNTFRLEESEETVRLVRSFICNKVPLLLSMLAGSPAPIENYVQMALSNIPMDPLPPISAGATELRGRLQTTRVEFLQACILHGVVSDNDMAAILHAPPTGPKATKYTKETLVARYSSNINTFVPLLDELGGVNGNAGAIAGCIVEIVGSLCLNKDTISLKTLCNALSKRLPIIDVVLQYTDPANLLSPLCLQLNDWTHDQDQMEYTPAYEEFASILLFVFAVAHRYGLQMSDIGLASEDNFISKQLNHAFTSKLPTDLTPEQSEQLSKWIESLYSTDDQGETGGISDDVMRPCPPQAFYELVPTLFEQSVLACTSGVLSMQAFKSGLELLVEPFLLPSLVSGLQWIARQSWEDHNDGEVLLQVLDKLLKPSSTSQETQAMHKIILRIVADPLYDSLQSLSQAKPGKKDVAVLMEILRPFVGQERAGHSTKKDWHRWLSSSGGIAECLRSAMQEQIAWVMNVGPTPPPKYTHRLFQAATKDLGANNVLDTIVAWASEQTENGSGPLALDICTAMICAPPIDLTASAMALTAGLSAPLVTRAMASTVRNALRLRTCNLQKLLHKPRTDAETLIRLARRVEAQSAVTGMPEFALHMPMPDRGTDQIMADLGFTDGSMHPPGREASLGQVTGLNGAAGPSFSNAELAAALDQPIDMDNAALPDLTMMASNTAEMKAGQQTSIFDDLDLELDQSLAQMQAQDGSNNNVEDDIFAGLDMSNIDDFNYT